MYKFTLYLHTNIVWIILCFLNKQMNNTKRRIYSLKRSYTQRLFEKLNGNGQANENNESIVKWKNFSSVLKENESSLREILGYSQDVMLSKFKINLKNGDILNATLIAIDGLVDEEAKRNNIIRPLIEPPLEKSPNESLQSLRTRLSVKSAVIEKNLVKATKDILKAQALLIVDGIPEGLIISIEGFEIRSIDEPDSERTV